MQHFPIPNRISIHPPQRSDHAMLHWQIRMMSVFLFHLSAFHVSGGRRGGVLVENNCQSMQLHILRRILSGGCCSTNYNPLHIFICSPAKWAVVLMDYRFVLYYIDFQSASTLHKFAAGLVMNDARVLNMQNVLFGLNLANMSTLVPQYETKGLHPLKFKFKCLPFNGKRTNCRQIGKLCWPRQWAHNHITKLSTTYSMLAILKSTDRNWPFERPVAHVNCGPIADFGSDDID